MLLSVDERFPLSFYFRIAHQIVKQAKVYREEGNLWDLYFTLVQYSRLMSEVIPRHGGFSTYSSKDKLYHKKILQEFNQELKKLEPLIAAVEGSDFVSKHSREKADVFASYDEGKAKHSSKVKAEGISDNGENAMRSMPQTPFSAALTASRGPNIDVQIVRKYSPSPVLCCIESPPIVGHVSHITIPESRKEHLESSCKESSAPRVVQDLHISARLMEEFMQLARTNTDNNLETCGILGAFLKNRTFYVTTLIVPKQESSSNSCQALNEEEIYAVQDQQSLFSVGWIHTHPSQTCFLSSIDLHTQYSYQVMLPEAVAIVMAPTDPARNYGIFRISDPGGINVLKECEERGFHSHRETDDGGPIYETCSSVYINPNLRLEVIDLRSDSP
ncbi:Ubiquitinyl hydrolase 1 protein [Dioscorea alata]|uniref:Ubiquitinyl hydrolase 1 protein n=1 Tax=Dioscorea alata TaxID=55571 RepID=A0ACB7WDS9_DIOAL|nr:Ubiquitinyl hydrolase 1 protein [Dioscorea alata]